MALNIKNPEVERLAADLARLTGETKTEAIRRSLAERYARLLDEFGIQEIPFGEVHWREAVEAFRRFGKGRHVAALNFGDCLAYAAARLTGEPLLFTGNDFTRTDIERA